jgi:hypothetical protein
MNARIALSLVAAATIAGPALGQAPLSNGGFDILDTVWFGNPRPAGYRLYNTTEYRRTDDAGSPPAVTRNNSAGSIKLPGALGDPAGQFTAVHSEEFRDPNNVLSGRNWPEYTFDPVSGAPIKISCWFNIPATDPVVGGRFGLKVCFLRSGSNFSCYQQFEWFDIDPNAAMPYPGTTIVPNVPPPVGSGLTAGPGIHTNGQWVKLERTFNQSEFGSFPEPPTNPARASLFAQRFSETTNSYGTVWVDDLNFQQVAATCAADFDGNGARTIDDIFIFLNAWFAMDPRTNVDGLNGVNIDDIFIFINIWFAGCP